MSDPRCRSLFEESTNKLLRCGLPEGHEYKHAFIHGDSVNVPIWDDEEEYGFVQTVLSCTGCARPIYHDGLQWVTSDSSLSLRWRWSNPYCAAGGGHKPIRVV